MTKRVAAPGRTPRAEPEPRATSSGVHALWLVGAFLITGIGLALAVDLSRRAAYSGWVTIVVPMLAAYATHRYRKQREELVRLRWFLRNRSQHPSDAT